MRIHFSLERSAARVDDLLVRTTSVDDLLVLTTGVDDLLLITFVGVIVKLLTLHLGHVLRFVRVRWTIVVWIRFELLVCNEILQTCARA